MSPESGLMQEATILEEAERIKPHLLEVEAQAAEAEEDARQKALQGKRIALGYGEAVKIEAPDLSDNRVTLEPVISPETLADFLPITAKSAETTREGRKNFQTIFNHESGKLAVFLGPCSVHDPEQLLEYATHVKTWQESYGDALELYLRFYPEKPRTILKEDSEWKGFTYDPYLNKTDDINTGVIATRIIACQVTDSGVSLVVERLNPNTPQYLDKLVAVDVIGARDTESQRAREYGQGTSASILYKNNTNGDVKIAVDAAESAGLHGSFIGMAANGKIAIARTDGNQYGGIILRGGKSRPNYYPRDIKKASDMLVAAGLQPSIVIDASHANSHKKAAEQIKVVRSLSRQVAMGNTAIVGVMLESNLRGGAQKIGPRDALEYGVSVTDECVDLEQTQAMLELLSRAARKRMTVAKAHYFNLKG